MHLIRLLPNGDLDPTFNNYLQSTSSQNGGLAAWSGIYPVHPDRWLVYGAVRTINGLPRGGIAVVDSSGNLLNDVLYGSGYGVWNDQGILKGSIAGVQPTFNGYTYIWGSYHGYDDGTTNDPDQRMISRLYGVDVGVPEVAQPTMELAVYPNPATTTITLQLVEVPTGATLQLRDALGREVLQQCVSGHYNSVDVSTLSAGVYMLEVVLSNGQRVSSERVVVE